MMKRFLAKIDSDAVVVIILVAIISFLAARWYGLPVMFITLGFLGELSCVVYLLAYLSRILFEKVPFIEYARQVAFYGVIGIILFVLNLYYFGTSFAIKPVAIAVVVFILQSIFRKKKA
ncbi:hypothetical protein KXQ82_19610 [Mucilaginibacter sp. HMF5004]|uniref:hypothetical protein n=1 Tax=Mucilaginibacter rivuli TaxID=2857527 RepID=UPI001C5EF3B7|nr:hypothetical protein [Mucilaginibacter rivuli]MBW4891941.1 hypothetical protein [Mucilaginibacter rivuli]